jgi:hypothetical protein
MTNAFAEAAKNAGQPQASQGTSNPLPFNSDNPFARPSDFGGGAFTPTPPYEALVGRTLVYVPKSFDPAANDPFNPGQTRAQWTVDLYVIDGGELRFWYKQKGNPNATPPTQDATVEQVFENCTPETPYVVKGMWESRAAIVPKLTGADKARQFLIGRPERGARKVDRDKGVTDAAIRQQHADWVARGKNGQEPKSVWILEDVTDMAPVMAWYEAHKDQLQR